MLRQIQDEILRLKKERDVTILAHSYQSADVTEVADFVGDSYALAQAAAKVKSETVILCGVRFMAEGVKLLCPDKRVFLSHGGAGCPMAEQLSPEEIRAYKRAHPDCTVVAYINTTAALKAECDVCVTSSSAVKIVSALPGKEILFIPDRNLGAYVAARVPDKAFTFMDGGCPIHGAVGREEALAAKAAHPDALLLVHPECPPDVCSLSDFVGSTTDIMRYAKDSSAGEFIIGTENAIVAHLQMQCPQKTFYPMSKHLICADMRLTTLSDVLNCAKGAGEEITLDPDTAIKARRCIEEMIRLGG